LGKIHRHLHSYPNYPPRKIKKEKKSNLLKDVERFVRKGVKRLKPPTLLPAIVVPFPWIQKQATFPSLAVIVHIYYTDLAEEILSFLGNIPFAFQLYISTDTKEKAKHLESCVQGRHSCVIRLAPNRGRDIAPKLITFSDAYKKHELFLHLHGKKTIYNQEFGQHWRTNLLRALVGSEEIVRANLELLSRKDIGIVYPRYFSRFPLSSRWAGNFTGTQFLLKELGLVIERQNYFDFPAGSMFWGKSDAIRPLVDLNLSFDDFPEEMGQADGTLAHAIERSILLVAEKQGYFGQQVALKSLKLPGYKFVEANDEASLGEAIELCRYTIRQMKRGLVKRVV
jgi:lipopolysaccharide biosynthesis protein